MSEQPIGIRNWRDLGGLPTIDGHRVRSGAFFRSAALGDISDDDVDALARLGLGAIFDLRTVAEREASPDRVPSGARLETLDVLADKNMGMAANMDADADSVPAKMATLFEEPEKVESMLGGGKGAELMVQSYRDMVILPSAVTAFRTVLQVMAKDDRPALVHCTAGKDRTGWAAAVVLSALGVDEATILADYMRTNELFLPALEPTFDRYRAGGGDPDDLRAVLGVRSEYLEAAFDQVRSTHGSMQEYLGAALEAGDAERDTLRERLLVRD
ncbi:MAG: tyrosine-protein phosphatase [Tomitella sp.]|nr:tyrosine-protein phosphatase [Tomitella sp.]